VEDSKAPRLKETAKEESAVTCTSSSRSRGDAKKGKKRKRHTQRQIPILPNTTPMFAYGWPKVLASGGNGERTVALEYDERAVALAVVTASDVEIWSCGQVRLRLPASSRNRSTRRDVPAFFLICPHFTTGGLQQFGVSAAGAGAGRRGQCVVWLVEAPHPRHAPPRLARPPQPHTPRRPSVFPRSQIAFRTQPPTTWLINALLPLPPTTPHNEQTNRSTGGCWGGTRGPPARWRKRARTLRRSGAAGLYKLMNAA
jgi:hypothetical protein